MEPVFNCYATAAFGMEGLVAAELKKTGLRDVAAENGGVRFGADGRQLFLCNLSLRFSDRIFLILASGECRSFQELFDLVQSVGWDLYFSGNESIDVSCKCTRSVLMSPRDCQSITKKAIIEKIRLVSGRKVFPEAGPSLSVHVSVRNDLAMILLNTSGDALSRRGYRTWNGEAPLRETLASALVELSGWRPGQPLHPGISRSFAMESYKCFRHLDFSALRAQLSENVDAERVRDISGSDIDADALELARRHFRQAGLDPSVIPLEQIPLQELTLEKENGVFLCNPPYGERLGDQKHCRILYHDLYLLKQRHPSWRLCAISSDPAFERSFGKRADRKRRLYNGRLECVFYIYY